MNRQDPLEYIRRHCQSGPVQPPKDAQARLVKLDGIRAVVFDIYGTLFSSGVGDISLATEQDRNHILQETLLGHGIQLLDTGKNERLDLQLYEQIQKHQAVRRKEGIEYPEVEIRMVWKDFLKNLQEREWIAQENDIDVEILAVDYETRVNPTQAMPGLATALATLRKSGFVMSIISNAQFFTPFLFPALLGNTHEKLGFSEQCSIWSYRLLEAKPSTQLYKDSAAQLYKQYGILPCEVLYVGNDLRNDIWPAQDIGFKTALFAGDSRSLRRRENDPNCRMISADLEITHLEQLAKCI
ncbi:MAG: HAD family hydrolase [Coraliomargaritaceae bacterium]